MARSRPGVLPEHGARVSQIQQLIATPPVSLIRVSQPRREIPPGQCAARRNTDRFDERASRASVLSFAPCESRSVRSSSVAPHRNRDRVTQLFTDHFQHERAFDASPARHNLRSRTSRKIQVSQSGAAVPEEVKSACLLPETSLSGARDIVTAARMMCMVIPRARLRFEYVIVLLGGS